MLIESGSSLSTFLSCPRKYKYKYIDMLDSIGYPSALVIGSIVHAIAEETHLGKPGALTKALEEFMLKYGTHEFHSTNLRKDILYATAIGKAWAAHWQQHNDSLGNNQFEWGAVEREWGFAVEEGKFGLVGKSDGYLYHKGLDKYFLYELKTASDRDRDGYIDGLQANSQINNNVLALHRDGLKCDGVIYDILWKPLLRQKKDETEGEFEQRVIDTITGDPDKYFTRHMIFRSSTKLDDHMEDLTNQFRVLNLVAQTNSYYRNTGSCKLWNTTCPYFQMCVDNNESMTGMYPKREKKLSELSQEIQEGKWNKS